MWLSVVFVLGAVFLFTIDREQVDDWAARLGRGLAGGLAFAGGAPFRLVGWAWVDRKVEQVWPDAPAVRPVMTNVATGETRPLTVVPSPSPAERARRAQARRQAAAWREAGRSIKGRSADDESWRQIAARMEMEATLGRLLD